jgi:hypothetical protein
MEMVKYLNDKNLVRNKITLVFDGFMIPKENLKTTDINKLLVELEQHVFNELEYKINW